MLPIMASAATLDDVKAAGELKCGVSTGLVGFAAPDANGEWAGFDVSVCRAVAAAVLGWLLGSLWPDVEGLAGLLGFLKTVFLSGLKMVIAPLIFFSLISGIFNLAESGRVGRLGTVTIAWYLSTTAVAIFIGQMERIVIARV